MVGQGKKDAVIGGALIRVYVDDSSKVNTYRKSRATRCAYCSCYPSKDFADLADSHE